MTVRPTWVLALRAFGSAAMLVWLLPQVHLPLSRWDLRAAGWLGAALAVTFVGIVLSALRWRQVLAALGLRARVSSLVSWYLAGQFVGNFLPSTIGGDVVRVTRLSAATGERAKTFASVVLERLSGWLVLPVITLVAMLINPRLRDLGRASDLALLLAVVTLGLLGVVVAAVASPWVGGRLAGSAGWRRFAAALHLGMGRFRRRPGAAASVLLLGVAYQLAMVLGAFLAARALGLTLGLTAALAFVPVVAITQVLPVTLGGLGLREGAFVLFLRPLGVATGQAVALGLLLYGLNLAVSLLGAPSFAAGPRPARALA
ncbi:MAG: lysylphosphatidylglycerol synthase transmembrane domain-containing protein [Acidimicrobiales bacterium]